MNEPIQTFDAARFKRRQHEQWNENAAAWYRWAPVLQNWFGGPTDLLLDLAQLQPGQRVLDIAAGAGQPTVSAAARVGPRGSVLAIDLSENMLEFARQAAHEQGLRNIATRVMDGENLELPDESFDVVLCRLGLMLMPNQYQALSEWRRVLKPGGRAAVMVFSTPERNPWGAVPVSIVRKHTQAPPTQAGQPGLFSLGADGALDQAFQQAGFKNIETYPVSAPLRMESTKSAMTFARQTFGAVNQMMVHLPHEQREAIWEEVEGVMREYEGPNGFEVPCEAIVGVGVK